MKEQLMSFLQPVLFSLGSLLAAVISYYVALAVQKLKVETSKIQDEQQRELANKAIDRLHDLIDKTVVSTEETVGKELKQAFADGQISKDEIMALCPKVRDEVYAQLSSDTKDVLSKELTDVQAYIQVVIENALKNMKDQSNPVSVVKLQEKQVSPEELVALQNENDSNKAVVTNLTNANAQLESQLNASQQQAQQLQSQVNSQSQLVEQLQNLQAENANLRNKIVSIESAIQG